MHRNALILALCILQSLALLAQAPIPDWCRALPRPEYKTLERVSISDPWFEVYKPAQGVFAIYEPHQAEETISYLIVGEKRALLFDTGMGISDLKKVIAQLTKLPIILLNSHTHNDHVGDNWEFSTIYGMDTEFTRQNARGSRLDAQAEITPRFVACCRRDLTRKPTQPGPGRSRLTLMMATASIWAVALWKSSQLPATRLTPSLCSIAPTVCSLRVTPTTPRPSGSSGLKPISMLTPLPFAAWPRLRLRLRWSWALTMFP
jgi:Metallo-beta-lactamase superfamily